MIQKKNLELSPYELLKKSKGESVKGVGVVTDQQGIFYSKLDSNDFKTHYGICKDIEKEIYPNLTRSEIEERINDNTYIFLTEYDAIIHFPENIQISLSQFYFILEFIKDISKYNREVDEKIPITLHWYGKIIDLYDIYEISEEKAREWSKMIRPSHDLKDEKIIGKVYSSNHEKGKTEEKSSRKK